MIALGFGVAWFGYTYVIYGYTLLKGYNITWRSLASPLNPYQWPKKGTDPPLIPAGQILPGAASTGTVASGGKPSSGQQPPHRPPVI